MRKSLLIILLTVLFAPLAMMGQETFALYEDATGSNSYVPVYGNWADAGDATAEFIIPATDIDVMTGGTISQMTFFLKSAASSAWNAPYEVYLSETDATELTGLVGHDDATLVFTGTLNGNSATMDVVFSNGYTYGGGNLLVGFYETAVANYSSASFKGVATSTNTAYYGYTGYSSYTSSATQFIPSITFTYELPQGDCEAPATLVADPVDAHEATLTWTEGSGTYNVLYKTAAQSWDEATTAESNLSAYTCTLSGLAANTTYQARVISVCDGETSNPKGVSFTTPIACPAPTGFEVAIVPGDGTQAVFSWTNGGEETEWQLCIDGDENNLITMTENPFTYNQFTPEQTYTAKMRAYCDNIDQSTWTNTVTFTPTNAYLLTVNDGTGTNEYVPFYGYYADSGCQGEFIIPADDLSDMQWGTISQLTFYVQNPASADFVNSYNGNIAKFEVYMNETENTTISAVDWSGIKVKNEAQLVITDYQMVVTLDQPYQYMGGNLMIGFKETSNGGYAHTYWYGVTAEGASMGGYGSSISQKDFLPKTTFAYTPGEEPSCYMPTGVTVNYTAGTEATVSWTSEATAWNMKVNGTAVEGTITNPYTLENLELGTTYEIQVQAVCDGSVSDWTPAVSFTTDDCLVADMCAVTIELTDSYGDGWNGGSLDVVNTANNMVLGTYTIEDGGDETFELYVCDGTTIDFVYTTGSYPTENGWYITDINGEVIAEHTGCSSGCQVSSGIIATYTMNCTPATCIKPTDFTVVAYGTTAEISWTAGGEETAWQLCVNDDEDNLIDVTENPYTLEGLTVSTDYTVRLRANCGDDDYSNWTNNVSFTTLECEEACAISYVLTANAYQGSYEYGWLNSGIYVYDADTDEQIDFWTVPGGHSEVTGTLPLCNGREIYFQWYSYYSTANDNILVGGYAIYDNKGDVIAENNGPMSENVEYTMDCSVPSCMWPTNLAVVPSYTSAEISWDGSAERGYNVKYRKAPIFFYEGFEYGLDDQGWTTIANGDVPSSGDFVNGWATYSNGSHSGSKSAASRSWVSDGTQNGLTLAADNYLITPQLEIQGTLKFWVKCSYPSSADEYEVLLSTGGATIREFTVTLKAMAAATGDWEEIVIDRALSEYVGQRCYIAIHHVYEDGELLLIDDFGLYGTEEDAGRWQEATTEVASIVINDLEMDSWYEYLVQGVCEEEESEWRGGEFHTLNGNVKTFSNDGYWDVDNNWFPAGVPTANQTAVINAEARIPAGCIATAAITIGQNGSLVVEDGGQLQNMGDAVTVTMEKNITGYGEGNANWYLISSGVFSDLEEEDVLNAGLINDVPSNYDYFEFDATAEGAEWVNKKDYEYFDMLHGFGYLYANKEDVTLRFTGTAATYHEGAYYYATAYSLTYDTEKPFGRLNLVGNCLTHDAQLYLYDDNGLDLIADYYKMYETEEGSKVMLSGDETIAPNEGVFIEATASSQRLVIGAPESAKRSSMLNIAVLSGNEKVDMARLRFGEGNNLTKFQLNTNDTKVYFPQDNKDYAVVSAGSEGEMPLNFKAEKNGTYTISFSSENTEFSYLHLIDNMTGNDIDLLKNSSYTFEAQSSDYASRFKLVFAQGANLGDDFAFISDGNIIVNGQGTLQVFDVTGRMISSNNVNNHITTEGMAAGVYMLRLINGDNVKTQKIVVR